MKLQSAQLIHTHSLTFHVTDWLANTRQPRVLHVFDNVCNLLNERGEVLSVVAPQIGNGPFNLVLERELRFSDYLNAESRASIQLDQLNMGDLTVHTTSAKLWNPSPDWKTLFARRDHIANRISQLETTNGSEPLNQPGLPIPQSLISNLACALAAADVSTAKTISSQLAGLGIGLTPSGDDCMLGALYAAWIIHPRHVASVLAQNIANIAAPLTTSLSAAWLRSAGRGEAGILWHEFFDALLADDVLGIEFRSNKIFSVGETSGADAMAGFINMFTNWEKIARNEYAFQSPCSDL